MKWFALAVAGLIALNAGQVWAGGGCCTAKKSGCGMESKASCADVWAKMNLTDEQKAKLTAAQAECEKSGNSADAQQKCMQVMKDVLTPEQMEQCKAQCTKMGAKGCPMMSKPAEPAK